MFWIGVYIVFSILYSIPSNAHFNFFIGQQEVKKLLGLSSSELYYVRNGVVNTYAMNFEVLVPANVSVLEFFWQSLLKHPLPYSWSLEYNNRSAMKRPVFNISTQGNLPNKVSPFQVKLECTGDISAEVRVLLHLNVSAVSHRHNDTYITFRRNKVCLKRAEPSPTPIQSNDVLDAYDVNRPIITDNAIPTYASKPKDELSHSGGHKNNGTSGRVTAETMPPKNDLIFYMALGSCCGLVIIILILIFNSSFVHSYLSLRKLRLSRGSNQTSYTSAPYATNPMFVRLSSTRSGSYATITSLHKYPNSFVSPYATSYVAGNTLHSIIPSEVDECEDHIYSKPETSSKISYYASSQLLMSNTLEKATLKDPRQDDIVERLSLLYIPRDLIILHKPIMEGAFGKIYKGFIRHPCAMDKLQNVIVKTVSEEASENQITTMLAEGLMMYELKHVNILSVFATNSDPGSPPLLAYPFPTKGNLKKYLQNCRIKDAGQFTIRTQDIINMAIQVAIAGVFLHTNGFYHKDLAARNCVVDVDLRVKVADSALSRDLFPHDYHCLGDNENRPIKWLSLESLIHRRYTAASDVWSFGVLLWELMTLAQQPYEEVDPYEMHIYLKEGYRLSQPINCPDDFFGMMTCCWLSNPDERPTFVQLLACLQDFQTAFNRFI